MRIRGLRRVAPWEHEDHFHPGETIQVPPYGFGETIVWLRDGFVRTEDIQGDEHVHLVGHVRHGRGGPCKPCSVDLERVNDAAEAAYEQEEGVTAAGTPVPRQTTVALNAEDVDEPEEKAPEHYVAVWFPGDLLCPGPDADTMCGWDLIDEHRWQEHGFGSSWGLHSDLPRSASATDLASQIAAELRAAARDVEVAQDPDGFVIDSIGIPGTAGFRQGPWTYPLFRVTVHPTPDPGRCGLNRP